MKKKILAFLGAAVMLAAVSLAQPMPNTTWAGVWQGELDGQPSIVLTLADDTGALGGTVVLNIIQNENGQASIVAREIHVLLNTRAEGQALSFQCRKPDGGLLDFQVKLTGADKATIHCLNCGADAPIVDIVRAQ